MHFFLGTTNQYKIREIGSILAAVGCTFEPTDPVDPDETEPDFDGNAILKARVYAAHAGGVTISEDSGLIIPALNGLPGPWSARFSDHGRIDTDTGQVFDHVPSGLSRDEIDARNNDLVLKIMEGIEQPHRAAFFKVVLVVADEHGEVLFKAAGESHGWIATECRGTNGFGYDPIFVGNDCFDKTYAELDSMRKNMKSHRKRVLNEFKAWLAQELVKQS